MIAPPEDEDEDVELGGDPLPPEDEFTMGDIPG